MDKRVISFLELVATEAEEPLHHDSDRLPADVRRFAEYILATGDGLLAEAGVPHWTEFLERTSIQ